MNLILHRDKVQWNIISKESKLNYDDAMTSAIRANTVEVN